MDCRDPDGELSRSGLRPSATLTLMSESSAFQIAVGSTANRVTMTISGEIDLDAVDAMKQAADSAIALEPRWVDVDLADVQFIDSSGLNALLAVRKRCLDIGAEIALLNAPRQVLTLLEMTGLTAYFLSADDVRQDG